MENQKWNGEELFMYDGDFVFIVDSEPDKSDDSIVLISSYPSGKPFRACWDHMNSATPEELKGIA